MKTTSTILCLLFSVALTAQVTNLPTVLQVNDNGENAFSVVPKQLSYDGSNRVYIRTADDQIAIYGNDFTPVKSITITPTRYEEYYTIKNAVVTISLVTPNVIFNFSDQSLMELLLYDEVQNSYIYTYSIPTSWTEDSIKTYLERDGNKIVSIKNHPNGDGIWFIPDMEEYEADGTPTSNYFKVRIFGKQYPRSAYLWKNGFLYMEYNINYQDESDYSYSYGEWTEINRETYQGTHYNGIGFVNYDTDPSFVYFFDMGDGVCLTQTLFNNDDKYEYLQFPCELTEEISYDNDGPSNGEEYESNTYTTTKTFYQYSLYKSFNVMSEDGTILQTVTFPNGFEMMEYVAAQIIQLSDEFYILCQGEMNDNATLLIYKINRSSVGASVEQVCAPIKVGAFPSIANRNQMITIQLSGDNAGNSRTNLQVVDMQGTVLNQQTIPAGQTSTTIPAHRLSNGMNLIKITQGSKTIGTEKVIIK